MEFHILVSIFWYPVQSEDFARYWFAWNGTLWESFSEECLARLEGILKSLPSRPSKFLEGLEKELVIEYNNILKQEELFWH